MASPQGRLSTTLQHLTPATRAAGGYEYTFSEAPSMATLSAEQRAAYDRDGFLVIRGLIPSEELKKFDDRFEDIAAGNVEVDPMMVVMRDVTIAKSKAKGSANITKLQAYEDDPILFDYCKLPQVLKYVRAIIGEDVVSMHTMLINKPPDTGKGTSVHPMHQDLWYFPFRPAERVVCSWTAMQDIDWENGCLVVRPGSHRTPLLKHGYPPNDVNKMYHGIVDPAHVTSVEDASLVRLHMQRGDTVFFHPLLFHGSGVNRSARFRRAISCHYASNACHWVDVSTTIQAPIKEEIEAVTKRKTGVVLPFIDYWKSRARPVHGCATAGLVEPPSSA